MNLLFLIVCSAWGDDTSWLSASNDQLHPLGMHLERSELPVGGALWELLVHGDRGWLEIAVDPLLEGHATVVYDRATERYWLDFDPDEPLFIRRHDRITHRSVEGEYMHTTVTISSSAFESPRQLELRHAPMLRQRSGNGLVLDTKGRSPDSTSVLVDVAIWASWLEDPR